MIFNPLVQIFSVPIIIFALKSSGRLPLFKGLIALVGENDSIVGSWLVKMTNTVLLQGRQYCGLIIRE